MKRRLRLYEGPDGKPLAFFPQDVVMVNSVNMPGKPTGLKDEKGNEVKPKPEYRPDLSAVLNERFQQPLIVKGEVQEVMNKINNDLHWAEGEE